MVLLTTADVGTGGKKQEAMYTWRWRLKLDTAHQHCQCKIIFINNFANVKYLAVPVCLILLCWFSCQCLYWLIIPGTIGALVMVPQFWSLWLVHYQLYSATICLAASWPGELPSTFQWIRMRTNSSWNIFWTCFWKLQLVQKGRTLPNVSPC